MAMVPPNPFNPGSPVDPHDFTGRIQYLEDFKQKLRQTMSGSLASMSIVGGYGIGKTSFLHKCKAITEDMNALPIYFSLNEIGEFSREMLAKILIERVQEKVKEEVILQRISSSVLGALKRIRVKTESGIELSIGDLKENIFPNLQSALTAAWKDLQKIKTAIVFLIDEARILERNRAELILYLRAVLEQLQINRIPVMIIPAGKLTITGPSGTGFSPLVRTFPPVILENFSYPESKMFIERKLGKASIAITIHKIKFLVSILVFPPFTFSSVEAGEQQSFI